MTVLQLAPSDRAMPGLRMAAMTCFGLMMVGLGATLVVMLPEAGAPLWPLVPMLTAGLGTIAAALFLGGKSKHSKADLSVSLPIEADQPGASAVLAELRAVLEQQRAELAGFQESCNTMTRDSMVVGVQLASFALDAQARLTTGVESAERVLTQPSAAMDRAADLAQRLEWTVPETLAAALAGAADAAAQSLGAAAAAAAGQIAALGEAATILRRDAAALDQAGREIANTGAQAVMRAAEAVGGITSVASTLPEAAATVTAAAKEAVDTMTLAASVLCADSAALDASGREAVQSAEALRTTGVVISQYVVGASQVINASLAALPELQAAMGAQTEQMAREVEALRAAAESTTVVGEHLAATASRSEAVLAELPEMMSAFRTASLELREGMGELGSISTGLADNGNAIATRMEVAAGDLLAAMPAASDAILLGCKSLEENVSFVMQGASSVTTAGDEAARMIAAEAGRAQEAGQGLINTVSQLLSHADGLRELAECGPAAAIALHEAVAVMISEVASAGASLRTDAEHLGTTGVEAAKVTWDLQHQANLLHEAGRILETGATEAVNHVRHIARTSVGEIIEASERVAATLGRADASVAAIEDAGRFVASAGHEVTAQVAQLSAICTHAEVQAALLPGLAQQIGSVAGWLQASAQAMPSPDMLTEVLHALAPIDRLATEIERLPAFTIHLERVLRAHATSAVLAENSTSMMPLRHLGGVEREAAALMAESEALAETVLSGCTDGIPTWLTGRTAEILSAVDTTIHRLRSVATAVALASDALVEPKPQQIAGVS